MDQMLDTWPMGTTINYDCGQAVIDTNTDMSTFEIGCVFNDVSKLEDNKHNLMEIHKHSFVINHRKI